MNERNYTFFCRLFGNHQKISKKQHTFFVFLRIKVRENKNAKYKEILVMKRIASFLIAALMICTVIPFAAIPAAAEEVGPTFYEFLDVGVGAYIDTGFKPNENTKVVMEVMVRGDIEYWFGAWDIDYCHSAFALGNDSSGVYCGYGNQGGTSGSLVSPGRHKVELGFIIFKLDNLDTRPFCPEHFSLNSTLYLFAQNRNGQVGLRGNEKNGIRFYSCQIFDAGKLVRDFVPATKVNEAGVLEVGVYDRENKVFYAGKGDSAMVVYKSATLQSGLPSGIQNEGFLLDFDGKITVSKDTTINALPAQSGILIGEGKKVTIEVKDGVTLTVNGGNASGRYGGGAGIEVPASSTLEIIGNGTLNVKGGNAAVGENGLGGGGGSGDLYRETAPLYSGAGGRGGNGGGGAGAGIGGRGGQGGLGGQGGAGVTALAKPNVAYLSGIAGGKGGKGLAGTKGGQVTVADTLKGKIQGGFSFTALSQGGSSGYNHQERYDTTFVSFDYYAYGGGGGGAGGNGFAGAGIGDGGAGAGGGGGGGSGIIIYWDVFRDVKTVGTGHGGKGGIGAVNGSIGSDCGPDFNTDGLVPGVGGQGGDADGGKGGDTVVYLDEETRAWEQGSYLDVSAGAYFDTGYVPTQDTRLVFDAEINNKEAALFGAIWNADKSQNYYVNSGGTSFGFGFGAGDAKWADDAPLSAGRHTVELDDYALKYDGVVKEKHDDSRFTLNGLSIYLCGIHIDNWAQTFPEQQIRFYSCQIYEGDTLVRDFIPAKIGKDAVLLDRENGVIYTKLGSGLVAPFHMVASENGLMSNDDCVLIDFDGTVTISENTTVQGFPAQSGILIGNGRTVTINIEEGVTLTVAGGDGDGLRGAGAGIEVPEDATLNIIGKGKLIAKGGDAAVGEKGEDGSKGYFEQDWNIGALYFSGNGGKGGDGGGGAGAGIGSRGGNGGLGGKGGERAVMQNDYVDGKNRSLNGIAGENGENGTVAGGYGKITVDNTVDATVQGGTSSVIPSLGGNFGAYFTKINKINYTFGGGGGGAGGNGYPAANIGSGGSGGAGGGGGGSGACHYPYQPDYACSGRGGFGGAGFAVGGSGAQDGADVTVDRYIPGAGGQGGLAGGGDGFEIISTAEQLNEIAKNTADGKDYAKAFFRLANDITYNGQPIGSAGHPFKGIFDGDGYTLTVNISKTDTGAGLFAETDGATIKNLEIKGTVSGKDCVGGVVGHAYGNTLIDNCHVTASVTGTAVNIGGVVGMLFDSTVSNCRVDATVESTGSEAGYAGGIVGWLHNNSKVVNCVKTGKTSGYKAVGGIVGGASEGDSVIANCTSIGNIKGFKEIGGIIGSIDDDIHTIRLYTCYADCLLDTTHARGYICGYNHNSRDEKVEGQPNTLTVEGAQLYYFQQKSNYDYTGQNPLPSKPLTTDNVSEALNSINTYVNDHVDIVPNVPLAKWVQAGNDIFPESCKGFTISYDPQNGTPGTGSILSTGALWIVIGGVLAAIAAVVGIVVYRKKKKPALADGEEKKDEE